MNLDFYAVKPYQIEPSDHSLQDFDLDLQVENLFDKLDSEKDFVLNNLNNASTGILAEFLCKVCFNENHSSIEKKQVIEILTYRLPFTAIMQNLLIENPRAFLHILEYIDSTKTVKIFDEIVQFLPTDSSSYFLKALETLFDGHLDTDEQKNISHIFLNSFSETYAQEFLQTCVDRLDTIKLIEVLACANMEPSLAESFINIFLSQYDLEEDQECFKRHSQLLIEKICLVATVEAEDPPYMLETFLECLDSNMLKDAILPNLKELSPLSQAYLLWSFSSYWRKKAIESQSQNPYKLAEWLETFWVINSGIAPRVRFISDFTDSLDESELPDFLHALLALHSPALPYLYSGFSDETLAYFLNCETNLRTNLLKNSLPETPCEIQQIAHKLSVLRGMRLCNESNLMFETDLFGVNILSLQDIYDQTSPSLLLPDANEFLISYSPLLQQIPPFLISIAMNLNLYKPWILAICPYLTDDQLKVISITLPQKEFPPQIEDMMSRLSLDQFKTILDAAPERKIDGYLTWKAAQLKNKLLDFKKRYQQFKLQATGLNSLGIMLERAAYVEQYDPIAIEASMLISILRTILGPYHQIIYRKCFDLENLRQPYTHSFLAIPNIVHRCEMYLKVFTGKGGHLDFLESVKPKDESMEPQGLEEISEQFWAKIKQQDLVYLGIEHAGKLLSLGFASDNDFECLGLSFPRMLAIDRILLKISALARDDIQIQINLQKKWETLLHLSVDTESLEFQHYSLDMISLLDMEEIHPDKLTYCLREIFQEAIKIPWIEFRDQKDMQELLNDLDNPTPIDNPFAGRYRMLIFLIGFIKKKRLFSGPAKISETGSFKKCVGKVLCAENYVY